MVASGLFRTFAGRCNTQPSEPGDLAAYILSEQLTIGK